MAFMKRDVNIGLLILIIAAVIVFSSFSVYYQSTFKNVSLDYQNKLEQLGQVTAELSKQKQELNQTYSLRVKAEEDRKTLDVKYTEVRDENQQLSGDNTNLRSEVSSTKNQLVEAQIELQNTKVNLAQAEIDRDRYKASSIRYESKLDNVCGYLVNDLKQSHVDC